MSKELETRIIQAVREEVSLMKESTSNTVSSLFYNFKDEFNKFKVIQAKEHTTLNLKMDEMIKHQKHTNGNVTQNAKAIKKINKVLLGSAVVILLIISSALTIDEVRSIIISIIQFT